MSGISVTSLLTRSSSSGVVRTRVATRFPERFPRLPAESGGDASHHRGNSNEHDPFWGLFGCDPATAFHSDPSEVTIGPAVFLTGGTMSLRHDSTTRIGGGNR